MSLSSAFDAVSSVFRRRPADFLPVYFLSPAVPAITRVVTFAGLIVAFVYLEVTGRLDRLRETLPTYDFEPPPPDAEPEAFAEWVESLVPLFELLFPMSVQLILLGTLALTVVVTIVVSAVVTAAQLSTCYARLRSDRGLTAAIRGSKRHWLSILGARLLEFFLWLSLTAVAVAAVAVAFVISPLLGVLAMPLTFLVWLVAVVVIRAVFAFVPVAIVVDDGGVLAAVRTSGGYVRSNPFDAFGYYVLVVVSIFALASLAGTLAVLGGGVPLVGILGFVLVDPALDLVKTALYGDHSGSISPPEPSERDLRGQLIGGIRRGWAETVTFVRATPALHVLALGIAVAGFIGGWVLSAPIDGLVTSSIAERIDGLVAPVAALEFATNNWAVAVSTALSGLVFAVPAVASLLFNGVVFGVYARTEVAPMELLAFVLPHGLIEIPAFLIAGALGLSLGVAAWRTYRRRATHAELADELERAFWVLVGVGILLAIAGVIEGFVSPFYWRPFL